MDSTPRVSVIMPVFNASETLNRAIESFRHQSFEDFELIVVNDGSTDNSLDILNQLSEQDSRVIVLSKANGGVASARQAGMDKARGEFFIHADSDDWVESNMLEEMVACSDKHNYDILIADYYVDRLNCKTEIVRQSLKSFESHEVLYSIYAKDLFGGLCHKLIKKSAYDKAMAHFIDGLDYCEDKLLLTMILQNEDLRIGNINKPFYHYVMTDSSLTRRITRKSFGNLQAFNKLYPTYLPEDSRYDAIIAQDKLDEFVVGFVNDIYSGKEIEHEFAKIRNLAFKTRSLRWYAGYMCIRFGFYSMAHKLIRY